MFHSYGDTSGTQSSPDGKTLVSVGVVATDTRWERFDGRWMAMMREFGVTELHMRDFAHSTGQYKLWKGDEPKRAEFLRRLTALAKGAITPVFADLLSEVPPTAFS